MGETITYTTNPKRGYGIDLDMLLVYMCLMAEIGPSGFYALPACLLPRRHGRPPVVEGLRHSVPAAIGARIIAK